MKHVEFNCAGRWADPSDTLIPQIEVEEGEVHEVSDALADLVVTNKRGKDVTEKVAKEAAKEEKAAEKAAKDADKKAADKEAAEKKATPAAADKEAAEK